MARQVGGEALDLAERILRSHRGLRQQKRETLLSPRVAADFIELLLGDRDERLGLGRQLAEQFDSTKHVELGDLRGVRGSRR